MSNNCVSWLGHRWSKWLEPETRQVDSAEAVVQQRRCEKCDAQEYRFVGVRRTYD